MSRDKANNLIQNCAFWHSSVFSYFCLIKRHKLYTLKKRHTVVIFIIFWKNDEKPLKTRIYALWFCQSLETYTIFSKTHLCDRLVFICYLHNILSQRKGIYENRFVDILKTHWENGEKPLKNNNLRIMFFQNVYNISKMHYCDGMVF